MAGQADRAGGQAVFQEGVHQRLVGAAQAGLDAEFGQLRLAVASGRLVLEQPGFQPGPCPFRAAEALHQAVQCAGDNAVEQGGHALSSVTSRGSLAGRAERPFQRAAEAQQGALVEQFSPDP